MLSSSFNSKARGFEEIEETVIDPAGRCVLVNFHIYSEPWTLFNLYTPIYDDESFIQDILMKVSVGQHNILVGGDFNFGLDSTLDKSGTTTSKTKAAKTTFSFMKDLNLTDVWRQMLPQTRDYSF